MEYENASVARSTRAWIETSRIRSDGFWTLVARSTRAWIETIFAPVRRRFLPVARSTRAWIETSTRTNPSNMSTSHALRVRGLKLIRSGAV